MPNINDVIIIGSGPAGYTAGLYAGRAMLNPLLFAGYASGGQLMLTSEVENYPGYPEGITGPEMMMELRSQASRFGCQIVDKNVDSVDLSKTPFKVTVGTEEHLAKSLIITTGAEAVWLDVQNESAHKGRGISTCATCDGFFFKDKDIAVVGGGDSAMEEALFLTKFANTVKIIHRRDKLRASKIMQERAINNDKIEFVWDSEVVEVLGDDKVKGIKIQNTKNKETSEIELDGLFVAIGHTPNTDFLKGQINLDELGYVVKQDGTRTNIDGVFVAGDVHDFRYRQAVTAAGHGCEAAMDVEKYLEANDL